MVVIEARERKHNVMSKDIIGINKDMYDMDKDLERAMDDTGTDGATLASAKAKEHRNASDIIGVREQSEGGEANKMAAVDMAQATAGREKDEAKTVHNNMEE